MIFNDENFKKAKSQDVFEFVCKNCGKSFLKTKKYISKNRKKNLVFCSQECQKQYNKDNSYITIKCENCGKEKQILKGEYNKSKNKHFFCNHSCSAIYTNKLRNKSSHRKDYNECPICGELKYYTSKFCRKCSNKEKSLIKERTLGSYINGKQYLTSKCGEIRKDARKTIEESNVEKVCAYCKNHEFDEILEVHHIKGILDFNNDDWGITKLNSLMNLYL